MKLDPRHHQPLRLPLISALLVVVLMLVVLSWELTGGPPFRTHDDTAWLNQPLPDRRPRMQYYRPDRPLDQLLRGDASVREQLLLNPDFQPLDNPPANMPAPPAGQLLAGFRHTSGLDIEEAMVWTIPVDQANVDALTELYSQSAGAEGFELLSSRRGSYNPNYRSMIFQREGRTLILRISQRELTVRVVVQLRYTMPTPPSE